LVEHRHGEDEVELPVGEARQRAFVSGSQVQPGRPSALGHRRGVDVDADQARLGQRSAQRGQVSTDVAPELEHAGRLEISPRSAISCDHGLSR